MTESSSKVGQVASYNSAGVVNDVQLYLGLFVCANGRTGGSIRYHVSRTTVASCATDMAQYGILCRISLKPVYKQHAQITNFNNTSLH